MGIIQKFFQRIQDADRARDEIDDNQTTDRYLRSLRRQSRVQDEEVEKEYLKQKIKMYEQRRANLLSKANSGKSFIIRQKKALIAKKRMEQGFLSRGNL